MPIDNSWQRELTKAYQTGGLSALHSELPGQLRINQTVARRITFGEALQTAELTVLACASRLYTSFKRNDKLVAQHVTAEHLSLLITNRQYYAVLQLYVLPA